MGTSLLPIKFQGNSAAFWHSYFTSASGAFGAAGRQYRTGGQYQQ